MLKNPIERPEYWKEKGGSMSRLAATITPEILCHLAET
jgi:hypothetical protein